MTQVPCCRCTDTMSLAYAMREGRYTCRGCDYELYGTGVKRKSAPKRNYTRKPIATAILALEEQKEHEHG